MLREDQEIISMACHLPQGKILDLITFGEAPSLSSKHLQPFFYNLYKSVFDKVQNASPDWGF